MSLSARFYNFIRSRTCPFSKIAEFVPDGGTIVDLGCGTGIFIQYLRTNSPRRLLYGFDWNKGKIEFARNHLSRLEGIKFAEADISSDSFVMPVADCIMLIDSLYYLNDAFKKKILKKCFDSLGHGGTLLVKDINKDFSLKFIWTFFQDFISSRVFRFNRIDGFYFKSRIEYLKLLNECGFRAEDFDISKGYFYSHILYVAKKNVKPG
ncbi:MAG: class I SAM-dependent methyltransferase [Candidatus Omnitrophica bacterium]|nr:class I SAM-dependent methyltransferase [Candidatus Omnitrophota bacterium]